MSWLLPHCNGIWVRKVLRDVTSFGLLSTAMHSKEIEKMKTINTFKDGNGWRVEAIGLDGDGDCNVIILHGPRAEKLARQVTKLLQAAGGE